MPEKRSVRGRQRRDVKRFIRALNFHDIDMAEIIFTVKAEDLFNLLIEKYGYVDVKAAKLFYRLVERHTLGDVLVDKRGHGTLQRVPLPWALVPYRFWRR